MPCWEMIANGRVQGVGFRWFAQNCAKKYSIKGYVRNLTDGTVCIVAMGDSEMLALFAEDIRQGNRHSTVKQLIINEIKHYNNYEDFVIA